MNKRNFTYGAEVEITSVAIDNKNLPEGVSGLSDQEYDLISIAGRFRGLPNDPTFKAHNISGELNTKPTDTIQGQLDTYKNILAMYPEARLGHRIDMHLHIGWSELTNDLNEAKKVLAYVYKWTPLWLTRVYPKIDHPDMLTGDRMFCNITGRSMPDWRFNNIMNSTSIEDFIYQHSTDTTGKYNARLGTRYAWNFISMKDHKTIEVRANYPTLDTNIINSHYQLITNVVLDAISDNPIGLDKLLDQMESEGHVWSKPSDEYDHEVQCSYRYCSYQAVGRDYIVPRWLEFKQMWLENPAQFKVNGWYNEPEYAFNKDKYTPMTLQEAIDQGLV